MDDNLTLNRGRIVKICNMIIESGLKAYFYTRGGIFIKTLDRELLTLMRRAGFIMVSLAVESGSDYVRNIIMGKNISREQIVNSFKMCHEVGMNTNAGFIVGMLEDTEKTIRETVDLLQDIEADRIFISVAKPLSGTRLFEQCVRDNLLIGGFDVDTLWTGEAELYNDEKKELYIRRLLSHSARKFYIKPYNLALERLIEIDIKFQQIAYEKSKA